MALGGFFSRSILLTLFLVVFQASGVEVEKVKFAEGMDVGGQKLVLNGAGLRSKRKFGINFRVYVAGLYLVKKSSDANAILTSEDPKILRMVFLRSISKDTLAEAMEEAFIKNCKIDCGAMKEKLKAYNNLMVAVKENSELRMDFTKDAVAIQVSGKESKSGKIDGAAFSKNMLAAFIGDDPPTPEFKNALLGK